MKIIKMLFENKHLAALTVTMATTIPGLVVMGFLTFPSGSPLRWFCLLLSGLVFVMCKLAYSAGFESGELQGWNDSYDVNNNSSRQWTFKDDLCK